MGCSKISGSGKYSKFKISNLKMNPLLSHKGQSRKDSLKGFTPSEESKLVLLKWQSKPLKNLTPTPSAGELTGQSKILISTNP